MTSIITLGTVALIAYPLILGILIAAFGGHRVHRWFTGLTRGARGLVAAGLVIVLGAAVAVWPRVVAPRLAGDGPTCASTAPARAAGGQHTRSAADFSAVSTPPTSTETGALSGRAAPTARRDAARTLILFDDGGHDWSGELAARQTAVLVSHFGPWTVQGMSAYRAQEAHTYRAVVYLGSAPSAVLPAAFLDDVLRARVPVLWVDENVEQLARRDPEVWRSRYAFAASGPDVEGIDSITYRGVTLTRQAEGEGVRRLRITDPAAAKVLAHGQRPDGGAFPWLVHASNLWYVAESPLDYTTATDRYLAFTDVLFDVLAPGTPERHRALLRLEDISPDADPDQLMAVATCLHQARVPFSFGVIPVYTDPRGRSHDGEPTTFGLRDRPEVVKALRYMTSHGGTMVMHGVTHQLGKKDNPYSGVTGEDYEFFVAHQDSAHRVVLDGLVPGHSRARTLHRLDRGLAEFRAAGLPRPQVFEFPHYAAGPDDYEAVALRFGYRYDETMTYADASPADPHRRVDQFYPYGVRDSYGTAVVPENLGNVDAPGPDRRAERGPADIIDEARRALVVRDGVASFFYHPPLGTGKVREIVQHLRGLGYEFVRPHEVMSRDAS
ncbi:DUF2334 domain-containing protein [Streptomyces sp. NRRL B-24085]|uniref:DUF2334 domain-containing protein n=1 Tax=Streptomyces sp. NRRL B-24085 TaxID=1709476 RepID=UPI00117C7FFC|nr:DUF2334 domain-containing protein [Streptomyces sp. NRRL B-24085]